MQLTSTRWLLAALLVLQVGTSLVPAAREADEAHEESQMQRRRLDQLSKMMMAKTDRHYSQFVGYGSFCGYGGSGVPVDAIDVCCQKHDNCFGRVSTKSEAGKCNKGGRKAKVNTFLAKYSYNIGSKGKITCLNGKSRYANNHQKCLRQLCLCDKHFAECLSRHKGVYNPAYLKSSQAHFRSLIRLSENYPSMSFLLWEAVSKMVGR